MATKIEKKKPFGHLDKGQSSALVNMVLANTGNDAQKKKYEDAMKSYYRDNVERREIIEAVYKKFNEIMQMPSGAAKDDAKTAFYRDFSPNSEARAKLEPLFAKETVAEQPEDNEIKPEDKEIKPEDKAIKPEGKKAKKQEDKEIKPEDKAIKPEDKEIKPEDKAIKPEGKKAKKQEDKALESAKEQYNKQLNIIKQKVDQANNPFINSSMLTDNIAENLARIKLKAEASPILKTLYNDVFNSIDKKLFSEEIKSSENLYETYEKLYKVANNGLELGCDFQKISKAKERIKIGPKNRGVLKQTYYNTLTSEKLKTSVKKLSKQYEGFVSLKISKNQTGMPTIEISDSLGGIGEALKKILQKENKPEALADFVKYNFVLNRMVYGSDINTEQQGNQNIIKALNYKLKESLDKIKDNGQLYAFKELGDIIKDITREYFQQNNIHPKGDIKNILEYFNKSGAPASVPESAIQQAAAAREPLYFNDPKSVADYQKWKEYFEKHPERAEQASIINNYNAPVYNGPVYTNSQHIENSTLNNSNVAQGSISINNGNKTGGNGGTKKDKVNINKQVEALKRIYKIQDRIYEAIAQNPEEKASEIVKAGLQTLADRQMEFVEKLNKLPEEQRKELTQEIQEEAFKKYQNSRKNKEVIVTKDALGEDIYFGEKIERPTIQAQSKYKIELHLVDDSVILAQGNTETIASADKVESVIDLEKEPTPVQAATQIKFGKILLEDNKDIELIDQIDFSDENGLNDAAKQKIRSKMGDQALAQVQTFN